MGLNKFIIFGQLIASGHVAGMVFSNSMRIRIEFCQTKFETRNAIHFEDR